jgi:hypothetical protein
VVADDAKKIDQIRLGDSVKMKYKKSSFDSIFKATKSIIEQ